MIKLANNKKFPIDNFMIKIYEELCKEVNLINPQDYAIAMFVVRFVLDSFRESDASTENLPNFHDLLKIYLGREPYSKGIASVFDEVIEKIEHSNYESLSGVFFGLSFNVLMLEHPSAFQYILATMQKYFLNNLQDTKENDIEEFEALLAYIVEKQYTSLQIPPIFYKLLSALSVVNENNTICDPFCNYGTSFVALQETLQNTNNKFYGQENSEYSYKLSKIRMFIHSINNTSLELGDSITEPKFLLNENKLQTFDNIISFIPSVTSWDQNIVLHERFNRFKYGLPPKNFSDFVNVLHMIESLSPNGTMCVIVPSGVLFRDKSEADIRQRLIEDNLIDSVITLPITKIRGHKISVSVLIIKKNREERKTFFVDASELYTFSSIKQRVIQEEHVEKIKRIYFNREDINGLAYSASYDELKLNGFSLHMKKYIKEEDLEAEDTLDVMKSNILDIKMQLKSIEEEMLEYEDEFSKLINKGVANE